MEEIKIISASIYVEFCAELTGEPPYLSVVAMSTITLPLSTSHCLPPSLYTAISS